MPAMKTRSGSTLTRTALGELTREAEHGYDLSKAKRAVIGRPPLGAAGESPRVQVRVDPELAEALKARATDERRSVSEVARAALREYVGLTG